MLKRNKNKNGSQIMKLPKKRQPFYKRPVVLVTSLVALAAIAGGAVYAYNVTHTPKAVSNVSAQQNGKGNNVDYNPPTDAQTKAGQDIKKGKVDQGATQPSSNVTASLSISRVSQSAPGQPISVRVVVDGTTTGQCVLTFTQPNQSSVIKTLNIAASATYYTCQADIPASDFPVTGEWSLSAYVNYNNSRVSGIVNWADNPINVQR